MEAGPHLLEEARVLGEVVRGEEDVREIVVEGMVKALGEVAPVAGYPAEADLAVPDRPVRELPPLRVLKPPQVVDRMVVVDVDPVGAKPPKGPFESGHHRPAGLATPCLVLGRDDEAVPPPRERLADRLLRAAAPIALGGVEVRDAAVRRVADEIRVGRAAGAEGDVGDVEAGGPELHVAPDARWLGGGPARRGTKPRKTGGEPGSHPEESPPVHRPLPLRRSGTGPPIVPRPPAGCAVVDEVGEAPLRVAMECAKVRRCGDNDWFNVMEGNMETAAFDTLAAARELEAAGMDRHLAEVTALNMHKAGTAHLDQLATRADLENHRLATRADLEKHQLATRADLENHRLATSADLEKHQLANETALAELKADIKMDMLKVAVGIVITNAGFVLAAVKFLS